MAQRLAREGVGPGDVVALLLPNTSGLVAALWGGLALGATVAPLNPLLAADERKRILGHLGPAAVLDTAPDEETAPELPIADARRAGHHPLYVGQHRAAQGRAALPHRARGRQRILGRPGDGARPGRSRAGRAAAGPFVRAERRAAGPAAGRRHGGAAGALLARGDSQSDCPTPRHGVPRRGHDVRAHPRVARAGGRGRLEPAPRGVRRGALPVAAGQRVAAAHRRPHRARLRDDRALPPHLLPRRRADRSARLDRPRGARRRAAPGGRRAVDPLARGHGRLPARARGDRRGARRAAGSRPAISPRSRPRAS